MEITQQRGSPLHNQPPATGSSLVTYARAAPAGAFERAFQGDLVLEIRLRALVSWGVVFGALVWVQPNNETQRQDPALLPICSLTARNRIASPRLQKDLQYKFGGGGGGGDGGVGY